MDNYLSSWLRVNHWSKYNGKEWYDAAADDDDVTDDDDNDNDNDDDNNNNCYLFRAQYFLRAFPTLT